jgi:hypothetical protein
MGWKFLFLIFLLSQVISSERILSVSFFGSRSHKNAFEPLYIELAKRGHQLTIIHPVKSGYNDKNMKEINGVGFEGLKQDHSQKEAKLLPNMFEMRLQGIQILSPISSLVVQIIQQSCTTYYAMPEVKAVLKQKFAVVLISSHMVKNIYLQKIDVNCGKISRMNARTDFSTS